MDFKFGKKILELNSSKINLEEIVLKESINLSEVNIVARKKIIKKKADKTIFNISISPFKEGFKVIELLKVTPYV